MRPGAPATKKQICDLKKSNEGAGQQKRVQQETVNDHPVAKGS